MAKATRIFNGKQYIYSRTHSKKSDAKREADMIRRDGNLARVSKAKRGYEVWYRR